MSNVAARLCISCAFALCAAMVHAQEGPRAMSRQREANTCDSSTPKSKHGRARKARHHAASKPGIARKRGKRGRSTAPQPPPPPQPKPLEVDLDSTPSPPVEDHDSAPVAPEELAREEADESPPSECSFFGTAPCTPSAGFTAHLVASAGATTRSIGIIAVSGAAPLRTGLVPALGLQLTTRWVGAGSSLDLTVAYQSSVGAKASQTASDPTQPPVSTSIHSHHLDAGLVPRLYLGERPDSATLGLFLGYGVRALASVVELRTPRFSMHGPVARLELILPLGSARMMLRLAPEAQYILSVSRDLIALSAINLGRPLWAFGGEAAFVMQLGARVGVQLAYRESHAFASDSNGSFEDVERFVLLGMALSYF